MKNRILFQIIFFVLICLFLSFMMINIYYSQTLNPLFFKIVGDHKKNTAITFLKKIERTKEFENQMTLFTKIYGKNLKKEFFSEKSKRKEKIDKLLTLLSKNDKARDVFLKLAVLYFEDKNLKKAKEYYQKAKQIDPEIKLALLEKL